MLLSLLFHRVLPSPIDPYTNSLEEVKKLLLILKENYHLVLPGQKLSLTKTSICLTFDDAFYDFYHYLFPFLKEHQIQVVLGIVPRLTLHSTPLPSSKRLEKTSIEAFSQKIKPSFCSWEELKEMTETPFVYPASHSLTHANLVTSSNPEEEIILSKQTLEKNLGRKIDTFLYPYGKFSQPLKKLVRMHYTYQFRIGSSVNVSWNNPSHLLYRIPMDQKTALKITPKHFLSWFIHTLRRR